MAHVGPVEKGPGCHGGMVSTAGPTCRMRQLPSLWHASLGSSPQVWFISPTRAPALRATWSKDLYVFSLFVDATMLWHREAQGQH